MTIMAADLLGFSGSELDQMARELSQFQASAAGALVEMALDNAFFSAMAQVRGVRSEDQAKGTPYANGILDAVDNFMEPGYGLLQQIQRRLEELQDEAARAQG